MEIKSVIRYSSGDVRFFTKDRAQARWLLDNRHLWTHLADPLFTTTQALFPVLVHSVPVHFDIDDDSSIEYFCEENDIPRENIKNKMDRTSRRSEENTWFIYQYMTDKDLAGNIIRGYLSYRKAHLKMTVFQTSPPQCFNYLEVGHIAHMCKNKPTCAKCGKKHNTRECQFEPRVSIRSKGSCSRNCLISQQAQTET
ncbi:hypothetical protein O181_033980 [Austropuccinia psidii MF-1]|uniref:Uncharacterized protein n=1 Tax=Austropuccinia psidii MF-1 TaxID=1389203 RepID=A0A9Q3D280_9BASI|nr:hypothetical protein [Austropuccinia psidii MF-1]